ncbi:hypothetical protein IHN63_00315 [Deinococcus sp. 6YEL10]|uniref:hypothetical protein n=1 Tax=Deinococcus sp. 6YEL10 TaxID=2745870 RepID=UPI001E56CF86|nr:hypothetical protein [Deinococcus sp. 6YEL10]MCD0159742.1 hypothetical protein [Deinococcus sp. 6YEL10]
MPNENLQRKVEEARVKFTEDTAARQDRDAATQARAITDADNQLRAAIAKTFQVTPESVTTVAGAHTDRTGVYAYAEIGGIPVSYYEPGAALYAEFVVDDGTPIFPTAYPEVIYSPADLAHLQTRTETWVKPTDRTWDGDIEETVWTGRQAALPAYRERIKAEREASERAQAEQEARQRRKNNPARALLAAHAIQGIIASDNDVWGDFGSMCKESVAFADAILDHLES